MSLALVLAWPLGAAAAPSAPARLTTKNAAVALLLGQGFSSITDIQRAGNGWQGRGVRHAELSRFAIDGRGRLTVVPAPSEPSRKPPARPAG